MLAAIYSFLMGLFIWQLKNSNTEIPVSIFTILVISFRRANVAIYSPKGDFQNSYFLLRATVYSSLDLIFDYCSLWKQLLLKGAILGISLS